MEWSKGCNSSGSIKAKKKAKTMSTNDKGLPHQQTLCDSQPLKASRAFLFHLLGYIKAGKWTNTQSQQMTKSQLTSNPRDSHPLKASRASLFHPLKNTAYGG